MPLSIEPPPNADRVFPDAANGYQAASARLILASHRALTGRALIDVGAAQAAESLYRAPVIVLAHDTAADPIFFYANLAAQVLFELPWPAFVRLPSRYSAEPVARDERARLLERVGRDGYIDDYAGVRISASGRRFRIRQATVWNLVDDDGRPRGQAAAFSQWEPL
jgi:hypothetical protein